MNKRKTRKNKLNKIKRKKKTLRGGQPIPAQPEKKKRENPYSKRRQNGNPVTQPVFSLSPTKRNINTNTETLNNALLKRILNNTYQTSQNFNLENANHKSLKVINRLMQNADIDKIKKIDKYGITKDLKPNEFTKLVRIYTSESFGELHDEVKTIFANTYTHSDEIEGKISKLRKEIISLYDEKDKYINDLTERLKEIIQHDYSNNVGTNNSLISGKYAIITENFVGKNNKEMTVKAGDRVLVLAEKTLDGWVRVEKKAIDETEETEKGFVPFDIISIDEIDETVNRNLSAFGVFGETSDDKTKNIIYNHSDVENTQAPRSPPNNQPPLSAANATSRIKLPHPPLPRSTTPNTVMNTNNLFPPPSSPQDKSINKIEINNLIIMIYNYNRSKLYTMSINYISKLYKSRVNLLFYMNSLGFDTSEHDEFTMEEIQAKYTEGLNEDKHPLNMELVKYNQPKKTQEELDNIEQKQIQTTDKNEYVSIKYILKSRPGNIEQISNTYFTDVMETKGTKDIHGSEIKKTIHLF